MGSNLPLGFHLGMRQNRGHPPPNDGFSHFHLKQKRRPTKTAFKHDEVVEYLEASSHDHQTIFGSTPNGVNSSVGPKP